MAEHNPVLHTPLQHATFHGAGVVIGENLFCAKVIVRGNFDDAQLTSRLSEKTGLPVNVAANTFVENDSAAVFWLGPDERMIYSYVKDPQVLSAELRSLLPAGRSSAVDVSDYYTTIRLAGVNARSVLSAGTPFDVHESNFPEGSCVQTRFGTASVMLVMQDPSPAFDIQVRWSFADYVWRYLRRVAEFRTLTAQG